MAGDTVRAAVVQLLADDDTPRNIARAGELVQAAAVSGAQGVVLPEKWNWWGPAGRTAEGAEGLDGSSLTAARAWARDLGVALVAGSILEAIGDGAQAYNTSVAIAPDGRDVAVYRKVHLFDVTVEGREYRESATVQPGEALATADLAGLRVGLSVCYDLRFPELYRQLAVSGATALAVPANFTVPTGQAHWEVLLRARAIEDQCFVLAAGQCGQHATGEGAYGHSMIVDPWGRVLAQVPDGEGFACADLDLGEQRRVREGLPALGHRRLP
ncbi:MAG: carbon-nitrogen hydrolase family protein [Actinomycetota bacterium]|nr:carbon-nitrogen hydrolase family protein [Actinomycetota bacterium]